jgi:hypothetical protein
MGSLDKAWMTSNPRDASWCATRRSIGDFRRFAQRLPVALPTQEPQLCGIRARVNFGTYPDEVNGALVEFVGAGISLATA